jgi:hypothetical protein
MSNDWASAHTGHPSPVLGQYRTWRKRGARCSLRLMASRTGSIRNPPSASNSDLPSRVTSAPMYWAQPCSSGQISMRSGAVTRSSQTGPRPAFARSLPAGMRWLSPPLQEGPDHDCHASSVLPLSGQSQRAHLDHLRLPGARRAAARRRARMPSRIWAGAPPRRPRSRRSLRPATQAPLERPTGSGESPAGYRGSAEPPITAVVNGDQDLSASGDGTAYLSLSRTIASDPSPVVRHANDTAQDVTASRLGVDGHMRRDRASVGRRCISGSRGAARCSAAGRLRVRVPG